MFEEVKKIDAEIELGWIVDALEDWAARGGQGDDPREDCLRRAAKVGELAQCREMVAHAEEMVRKASLFLGGKEQTEIKLPGPQPEPEKRQSRIRRQRSPRR